MKFHFDLVSITSGLGTGSQETGSLDNMSVNTEDEESYTSSSEENDEEAEEGIRY